MIILTHIHTHAHNQLFMFLSCCVFFNLTNFLKNVTNLKMLKFVSIMTMMMTIIIITSLFCAHTHSSEWSTDQLQRREVAFPPQVSGHVGSQGCQAVVQVHHHVNQRVDLTNQEGCGPTDTVSMASSVCVSVPLLPCVLTLAPGHVFHPSPPVEDHGGVVVDVQEGQLAVLLSQDEKYLKQPKKEMMSGCETK